MIIIMITGMIMLVISYMFLKSITVPYDILSIKKLNMDHYEIEMAIHLPFQRTIIEYYIGSALMADILKTYKSPSLTCIIKRNIIKSGWTIQNIKLF